MWLIGWNADYLDPHSILSGLLDATPALAHDERVTSLLEQANSVTDPDERWRLYREADRLLVDETVAAVPLVYMSNRIIHRRWVEGIDISLLGVTPCDRVVVRDEARPRVAGTSD